MRKGIYVLPGFLAVINLSLGFLAIIKTIEGNFSLAAWFILIAIVFDILDGRVARWTGSTSKFGIEFDSFADLISFGVAPAILIYQAFLIRYSKVSKAIVLIFVVAATLRLAKFNVKSQNSDAEDIFHFQGLPVPAAGGFLVSFVLVYQMFIQEVSSKTIPFLMKEIPFISKLIPLLIVLLSYLMVSSFRYSNFKRFKLNKRKSFRFFILLVTFGLIVFMYPQNVILIISIAYMLSGIIDYVLRIYILRKKNRIND